MKFVTFNIRYDCGEDGINNFDLRKPFILKKIQKEQADIKARRFRTVKTIGSVSCWQGRR